MSITNNISRSEQAPIEGLCDEILCAVKRFEDMYQVRVYFQKSNKNHKDCRLLAFGEFVAV